MIDFLWRIKERFVWQWVFLTTHKHKYQVSGMAIYKGDLIDTRQGMPITAWWYKCKCGHEICELDEAGVELIKKGATYYDVTSEDRV